MGKGKSLWANQKERVQNWLYDHLPIKHAIQYVGLFILSSVSAFLFAFGFNTFVDLNSIGDGKIVAGGVSGISQTLTLFLEVCGLEIKDENLLISILYFVLNVPVIVLAWVGIGKKYTIFTLVNVVEVSLFVRLLNASNVELVGDVAEWVSKNAGFLARAIFGGVTTGMSSALALKGDFSAGGVDIIAHYLSLKKRTSVGKYSVMINITTMVLFTILSCCKSNWAEDAVAEFIAHAFFSTVYLFVAGLVIDRIHTRNKKCKVEVVTNNEALGQFIITNLPHSATMTKGIGVYTGTERYIFTIVISSYEVNEAMRLIKEEDPNAFIQVTPLERVEGRFYTRPIQ
ncbi:MAG: YitT family protein [Erysipelotrichaceae bacterium]|nr:YitT family protein [Erysipelotrichaceae bacterium]